jgi:hypothetical protein
MRSWLPLCGLIAIVLPCAAGALTAPGPLADLDDADRKALETIAGHSETLRDAVLKSSTHVDELIEIQRIQEQSSASFQERIGKLDRKQQEQMWEIVREPGLLTELATETPPSSSELDEIVKRHPEDLAPAIHEYGAKHHDLVMDVAAIHDRARDRFDAALSDLDEETQQAFRKLVDEPELMSVLVHRVNLVVWRAATARTGHPQLPVVGRQTSRATPAKAAARGRERSGPRRARGVGARLRR